AISRSTPLDTTYPAFRACLDLGQIWIDAAQPGFFPEHQAPGFAPSMPRAVAPHRIQVHRVCQAPQTPRYVGGVAGLVRARGYTEALAAKLQHLRHKGQVFEPAVLV